MLKPGTQQQRVAVRAASGAGARAGSAVAVEQGVSVVGHRVVMGVLLLGLMMVMLL